MDLQVLSLYGIALLKEISLAEEGDLPAAGARLNQASLAEAGYAGQERLPAG